MGNDNQSAEVENIRLEDTSLTTQITSVSDTKNERIIEKEVLHETSQHSLQWQNKLLPWMLRLLIGLTAFFFISTSFQIYYINLKINQTPDFDWESLRQTIDQLQTSSEVNKIDAARWKTLAMLEENSLRRRYHQASVLLMSRTWTRYLGFVTGMILALVGAIFILGKLREPESKIEGAGTPWKFSISSSSPGLILASLGTILMITTMVTPFELGVEDKPSYLSTFAATPNPSKPEMLGEQSELQNLSDEELEKRTDQKVKQMNSAAR